MVSILAGALACLIAGLELITSRYRNTYFLLWRRWQFYVYVLVYGAVGLLLMLFIEYLVARGTVSFAGTAVDSPWVQAVLVGVSTKALMNITLFNVAGGAGTVPIGPATIVHLFEPLLLGELDLRVWNDARTFLQTHAAEYNDLDAVRTTIRQNIPPTLSTERQAALRADIQTQETVIAVMEVYLYAVGRATFVRSLPLSASRPR